MSLLQKIKDMSLMARKEKDPNATFLVTLYAEAARVGKDKGQRESTDDEVIAVLKKFKDGANTIIQCATKRGGDSATAQEMQANAELKIIESFLPAMLSEDDLIRIINGYVVAIPDASSKSMGIIMGNLKQEYPGSYDGKLASKLVKDVLDALNS